MTGAATFPYLPFLCAYIIFVRSTALAGSSAISALLPLHPSHQLPFNPARRLLIRYERQKVNRIRKILDFRRLPLRRKLLEVQQHPAHKGSRLLVLAPEGGVVLLSVSMKFNSDGV